MKKQTEKKIQEKLQALRYPHSEAAWQKLAESMEGGAIAVADQAPAPQASRKKRRLLWLLLLLLLSGIMTWGYQYYGFSLQDETPKQYLGYFPINQAQSIGSKKECKSRAIVSERKVEKSEDHPTGNNQLLAPAGQAILKNGALGNDTEAESNSGSIFTTQVKPVIAATKKAVKISAKTSSSKNEPTTFELPRIQPLAPDSVARSTSDTIAAHYRIQPLDHHRNAIYLEALGAGGFASLKYERRLSDNWYGTAGLGYTAENSQYAWTIPLGIQRRWDLFPKRHIGLQAGMEMAYVHPFTSRLNDQQASEPYFLYYPNIGLRKSSKNRLAWKFNVGTIINVPQDAITPWVGVGIGRRF